MTRLMLARMIDHSVLKPETTARDIAAGVDVLRAWNVAYYCVQPCWVALAAASLAGTGATVISVVGFPHGCDTADTKARATGQAIADGAREIDTVMHFGALIGRESAKAFDDVTAVVRAAQAHRRAKAARLPHRRRCRCGVRQDVDGIPSGRRRDRRRRGAHAHGSRLRCRRQGVRRHSHAGRCARDDRSRREPDRRICDGDDPFGARLEARTRRSRRP